MTKKEFDDKMKEILSTLTGLMVTFTTMTYEAYESFTDEQKKILETLTKSLSCFSPVSKATFKVMKISKSDLDNYLNTLKSRNSQDSFETNNFYSEKDFKD